MEEKNKKNIEENKELGELKKKCEEYLNGWKRERADFLNYKKEEIERTGQLIKYANEEIILNILPILDNFCLAEKHISDSEESAGFLQIKKQLEDLLVKQGIKEMKTLYEKFDPNYMEVVEEVLARDASHSDTGWEAEEPGVVVEVVQNGYTLHDKIIRPARVKISK